MNWIERMYELKGKDIYSQNGEGIYLEYILSTLSKCGAENKVYLDIGGSDGFHLSNTRHIRNILGWKGGILDAENGHTVTVESLFSFPVFKILPYPELLSIDIDGNDYWILDEFMSKRICSVVIAEFNAAFSDSRTIKYNPDHVWDGTDYYGFSFEAGKKLFEKHGYKVIFNVANMNMIAVREDLIKVSVPTVTYEVTSFFEKSVGREWVIV